MFDAGESEEVSQLDEDEMADTPRGGIDRDEVAAPPSVTAAPQPPPYSETAGEGQYAHTHTLNINICFIPVY